MNQTSAHTPQVEDGFTMIAGGSENNDVLMALIEQGLNGTQYQIMLLVIRKTWGFNKKEDWISLSQFEEITQKRRWSICREIKQLVTKNLLVVTSTPGKNAFYAIQKDFSKWKNQLVTKKTLVTNRCKTSHISAPQLVTKKTPTKYTITKDNIQNTESESKTFIDKFNLVFEREFTMTSGRRKTFSLRLKKFGIEKLLTAIDRLALNPFNMGENDRGWRADPDYLLRSEEQVEKILNYQPKKQTLNLGGGMEL